MDEWVKMQSCRESLVLDKYSDTLKDVSQMSKGDIEIYMEDALKELLDFVYDNNQYYRNKLDKQDYKSKNEGMKEIISQLEFTTKDELRNNHEMLLSVPKEKILQIHTSTGTSGGNNIYMMYSLFDLYGGDMLPKLGQLFNLKKSDIVAIGLPYEMSSAGQSFHRVSQIAYQAAAIPIGKGGAYSEPEKAVRIMADLRCNILITSPSYVYELMRAAEEADIDIKKDINLDLIWLTGEGCSNSFRVRIEEKWNTTAKFYYGSLECGALGIECDAQNGYHIPSSHVYIEIVNPVTGEVLEDGEIGEIVVTTLLREGMPLIRYRTEDLGFIDSEICSCGISHKKLYLRGRSIDQITIEGKKYAPLYIEEMLMRNSEVGLNYRLDVYHDYVNIIIELDSQANYYEGMEEVLSSKVEFNCGIPNKVTIVSHISFGGKKARRVNYLKEVM